VFKVAALINEDGLRRLIQRRKFDNKVRLDVDDVLMLLEALDERDVLARLPKYVAADLSRARKFNSGDLDMTLLMLRVATMEAKMSQMVGNVLFSLQQRCQVRCSGILFFSEDEQYLTACNLHQMCRQAGGRRKRES